MSGFYSFSVWSQGEVPLPEVFVVLERGQNGFNCIVKDLGAFVAKLEANGVRLLREPARLDDHEPLDTVVLRDGHPLELEATEPEILVDLVSTDFGGDEAVAPAGTGRRALPAPVDEPEGH